MQNYEPSETTFEIIETATFKSWINHTALAIYKISSLGTQIYMIKNM